MGRHTATFMILVSAAAGAATGVLASPGEMEAVGADGAGVALTLRHTEVSVEVSGFVAHSRVEQTFSNPFEESIEVVYKFPLNGDAAVDDFELQVGGRVIVGEVRERREARRVYRAAQAAGHQAALLEQERENLFTQSIANVQPGEDIVVRIRVVETLRYREGTYEYRFPLVLGDVYESAAAEPATPTAAMTTPGVEPRGELNPQRLAGNTRPGNDIRIVVDLDAGVPVRSVYAVEHTVYSIRPGPTRARVELAEHDRIPDRDFILRWDVDADGADVGTLTHRSGVDGFVALQLQPRGVVGAEQAAPKEILLVIDSSGSMSGEPIETAKRFATGALSTLGPDDTFNLIQFAGGASTFEGSPLPSRPHDVRRALGWLRKLSGGGGTEMLKGLRKAVDQPDAGRYRMIVFLTDGQIGAEQPILDTIRGLPDSIRVFTVGMGHGINDSLLSRMAEIGGGVYTEVAGGNAEEAIDRFRGWVTRPYLTDIEVDWGALPVGDFIPEAPRDLFSGQNLNLIARYYGAAAGTITVRGRLAGEPWEQSIDVSLPESNAAHAALATVWARRRIDALLDSGNRESVRDEVIELATEYRLMSPFTSFVAVDLTEVVARAARTFEHPHGPHGANRSTMPQSVLSVAGSGIAVQVVDDRGPLPGALVTIRHPEQLVKTTTIPTGPDGIAEFPDLRPDADYRVDVEFPGLGRTSLSQVVATRGVQNAYAVQMSSQITESVVVTSAAGVVDLQSTSQTTTFTDEFIQDMPVPGRFYQNVLTLTHGVQDSDGDGNPNVHGSRPRDFKAIVSGVGNVDPLTGGWTSRINPNSIEEMEVITAGAGVAFARAQGGFASIIQKQGSNDIEGKLSVKGSSGRLDGNGAGTGPAPDGGGGEVTLDVSGPVVRDELWYRVSTRREDRETVVNVVDGFETVPNAVGAGDVQLSWQAMPRNKLALKLAGGSAEKGRYDASALIDGPSAASRHDDGREVRLTWTAPYSPKLLFESDFSLVSGDLHERPADPGALGDCGLVGGRCIDLDTGRESGSFFTTYARSHDTAQLASNVTFHAGQVGKVAHTLRFGVLGERQRARAWIDLGAVRWFSVADSVSLLREPVAGSGSSLPAEGTSLGLYLENQMKIGGRFHVTAGLRFDRRALIADGGSGLDIANANWTPHLSVAFDPWTDGKTSVSASARRYYHEHPVDLALWEQQPETVDRFEIDGAERSLVNRRLLDRSLETPYRDEWTVAFEREILVETRLTLRWVSRRMEDQYRVRDVNVAPDGSRRDRAAGALLQLDSSGRADYDAFSVEILRRQYRGLELRSSYTWADARTDAESPALLYGDERDLIPSAAGAASWVSRHAFAAGATYILPGGFVIGGRAAYGSGLPFSRMAYVLRGDTALRPALIYTEKRNSRNHERLLDFDFQIRKGMNLGRGLSATLSAEMLNLLGDDALVVHNPRLELGRSVGGVDDARRRFGRHYRLGVTLEF